MCLTDLEIAAAVVRERLRLPSRRLPPRPSPGAAEAAAPPARPLHPPADPEAPQRPGRTRPRAPARATLSAAVEERPRAIRLRMFSTPFSHRATRTGRAARTTSPSST